MIGNFPFMLSIVEAFLGSSAESPLDTRPSTLRYFQLSGVRFQTRSIAVTGGLRSGKRTDIDSGS
jgi:hypothetical protein